MNFLSNELRAKISADSDLTRITREFDLIARALNGDRSALFGSLRVLVRRFGRQMSKLLIAVSLKQSHYDWILTIAPRGDASRPDGGERRRQRKREFDVNEIGIAYYRFRQDGLSDNASVKATQNALGLNLTPRTIRAKLQEFRKTAVKRGYVDPYAASQAGFLYSIGQSIPEPHLTIADITKKGRPLKKVQTRRLRFVLFPPLKGR